MIQPNQVRPEMPVVCSEEGQFGIVDHMEGKDTIKLKKDAQGLHHYIPMSWVTSVDSKIHVDRTGQQAMKDWTSTAPARTNAAAPLAAAPTPPTAPSKPAH